MVKFCAGAGFVGDGTVGTLTISTAGFCGETTVLFLHVRSRISCGVGPAAVVMFLVGLMGVPCRIWGGGMKGSLGLP